MHFQYSPPANFPFAYENLSPNPGHREAVVNAFVYVHLSLHQANTRISRRGGRTTAVTPRHFLDFINHYVSTLDVCCFDLHRVCYDILLLFSFPLLEP